MFGSVLSKFAQDFRAIFKTSNVKPAQPPASVAARTPSHAPDTPVAAQPSAATRDSEARPSVQATANETVSGAATTDEILSTVDLVASMTAARRLRCGVDFAVARDAAKTGDSDEWPDDDSPNDMRSTTRSVAAPLNRRSAE